MIDFRSLELIVNNTYSFVGIEKQDNNLRFCLPKGFVERLPELNTFVNKRDIFFLFYKILGTFKNTCIEKGYLDEIFKFGTQDRDGVINSTHGSEIQNNEDSSQNIFYSKLDIIGQLLNVYDEPKILALAYRLGKSNKFDLSQIHKYLHQAVYLHNHAAYVDQMLLPRQVVQFESADIVTMYCYLFCEVKKQLGDLVSAEIAALAERFRQHYLGSQDSLFDEQCYEQVLDYLKEALETIDHNTSIKDFDYWEYYESIELFLYGDWYQTENGKIWGIKDFYSVWESMCLTYLVKSVNPSSILYLDTQFIDSQTLEMRLSSKEVDLSSVFQINGSQLVPDAVVLTSVTSQLQARKTYRIGANTKWNDYGYRTIIGGIGLQDPKVAYVNQAYEHTIQKLQEIYQTDGWAGVIINAPLPDNFYSFWEISEQLDSDSLHKMSYFNHFFYLALKRRIVEWDRFYTEILQPLGVFFGLHHNDPRVNVFTQSLFRDYSIERLKKEFDNFIQKIFIQHKEFFEIIDIKYLTSDYIHDYKEIDNIKCRSVRKQFVYEYLLQKALERKKHQLSNLSIRSSFWLPSYRPNDSNLLEDGEPFMDGYIQLKNVNFMLLSEAYLS